MISRAQNPDMVCAMSCCDVRCALVQSFVGVDASTFSVAVQQQRQLWGIRGGGKEVMVSIKGLPDFHQEMMRLGSTFSRFSVATAQS